MKLMFLTFLNDNTTLCLSLFSYCLFSRRSRCESKHFGSARVKGYQTMTPINRNVGTRGGYSGTYTYTGVHPIFLAQNVFAESDTIVSTENILKFDISGTKLMKRPSVQTISRNSWEIWCHFERNI